jgi:hypothetical protein
MHVKAALAACALLLSACATVTNETFSTIMVDGESYKVRERTLEGRNGPIKQSSVWVKGGYSLCIIDSPGDCEAAIRNARSRFDDR